MHRTPIAVQCARPVNLATVLLLAALFPWEQSPSWVTCWGDGRSLLYGPVFPRWGCTKGKGRGALGEQYLKIGHYFQKSNFAQPTGPVQKSNWRSEQLRRVPALSRCCLYLSRGEAGGVSAPFLLPPLRKWYVNCLPGKEWRQQSNG